MTQLALDRVSADDPQVLAAVAAGGGLAFLGLVGLVLVPEEGLLFGLFGVNTLHHGLHLATGGAGVVAGLLAGGRYSRQYNQGLGVLYLVIAVGAAAVVALATVLNANLADNVAHFVLALGVGAVGFGVRSGDVPFVGSG